MITRVLVQPVSRLLVLGFVVIALVPLAFLIAHLYQATWDDAWREISEKHRLLAMNLAAPISIYVNDHRNMLGQLADEVASRLEPEADPTRVRTLLQSAFAHLDGFRSLSLVDHRGRSIVLAHRAAQAPGEADVFANENCFLYTRRTRQWTISNIKPSPISGEPSLIMSQPVIGADGTLQGVLLGELRIDVIESLRRNIRFGVGGHSAIVDKVGHVIAHPNPAWMTEMHDLSHLPVVREMMAGRSGVMEFHSPFVETDMVAGYAAVPEIGWGVMVPQPKSEVQARVDKLIYSHLSWALIGLVLAIILSVPLARWITRPINRLATQSLMLSRSRFESDLPQLTGHAPREVAQLATALRDLVASFQASQNEVKQLNRSLQVRVDEATLQLREANAKLEVLARSDHLTQLPNRRHFETTLDAALGRRQSDHTEMCIMLIDIDHFKQINDTFGHGAGDAVLTEVAMILEAAMRHCDLVARFGGDEFIARMQCNRQIGLQRAESIRSTVETRAFPWNGRTLHATVSIGLLYCGEVGVADAERLVTRVDQALYEAKHLGRNRVVAASL